MPPVFGPVSPSPTRLWSCAAPSGSAVVPSQRAKKETSCPTRHSSTSTVAPAAPCTRPSMISATAASASSTVAATTTPLPAARPSALTTIGAPCARICARAASGSANRAQRLPGAPAASATSRVKALLPSNRAAAWLGPKHFSPAAAQASARPRVSGASGPTTTRSTRWAVANATRAGMSSAPIGTHSAISAMPALPGAQNSLPSSGDAWSAQHSACSRPPPPTTRTLMPAAPALTPPRAEKALGNQSLGAERATNTGRPRASAGLLAYTPGMDTSPPPNVPEFAVAELAGAIKRTLEGAFGRVRVRGEITELRRYPSGHIYLALKDENAKLKAVIWKATVPRLGLKPEEGVEVIATGKVTTYGDRSEYQLVIDRLEYAGEGALLARIET